MNASPRLILAAGIASGLIVGFLSGGHMALQQEYEDRQASWNGIRVLQGDTVVANPAALTPTELAAVQIDLPFDGDDIRLVGLGCLDDAGKLIRHPVYESEEDNFPSSCREIHYL